MTDKEAMKLALDALEDFGNHDNACPQWPTYSEPEKYPKCNCGYDDAITALKERLAQPEQEPVAWRDVIVVNLVREGINKHRARELAEHFIKLTTPPAQPAPVQDGWILVPVTLTNDMTSAMADALEDPNNERSSWDLAENMWQAMLPKVPTPPQRTEPTCPECKAEVLYECVACSSNNYPPKEKT